MLDPTSRRQFFTTIRHSSDSNTKTPHYDSCLLITAPTSLYPGRPDRRQVSSARKTPRWRPRAATSSPPKRIDCSGSKIRSRSRQAATSDQPECVTCVRVCVSRLTPALAHPKMFMAKPSASPVEKRRFPASAEGIPVGRRLTGRRRLVIHRRTPASSARQQPSQSAPAPRSMDRSQMALRSAVVPSSSSAPARLGPLSLSLSRLAPSPS